MVPSTAVSPHNTYAPHELDLSLAVAAEELDRVLHRGFEPSPEQLAACGPFVELVQDVQLAYFSELSSAQVLQLNGALDTTPHEAALREACRTWARNAHFATKHQPHMQPLLDALRRKQPVFDGEGVACCSLHPTQRLRVSRDGRAGTAAERSVQDSFVTFAGLVNYLLRRVKQHHRTRPAHRRNPPSPRQYLGDGFITAMTWISSVTHSTSSISCCRVMTW